MKLTVTLERKELDLLLQAGHQHAARMRAERREHFTRLSKEGFSDAAAAAQAEPGVLLISRMDTILAKLETVNTQKEAR